MMSGLKCSGRISNKTNWKRSLSLLSGDMDPWQAVPGIYLDVFCCFFLRTHFVLRNNKYICVPMYMCLCVCVCACARVCVCYLVMQCEQVEMDSNLRPILCLPGCSVWYVSGMIAYRVQAKEKASHTPEDFLKANGRKQQLNRWWTKMISRIFMEEDITVSAKYQNVPSQWAAGT